MGDFLHKFGLHNCYRSVVRAVLGLGPFGLSFAQLSYLPYPQISMASEFRKDSNSFELTWKLSNKKVWIKNTLKLKEIIPITRFLRNNFSIHTLGKFNSM